MTTIQRGMAMDGEILFWTCALVMTFGAAAVIVSAAMRARHDAEGASDAQSDLAKDVALYRAQLAEVDRDIARGLVTGDEAMRLRAEVARRLLDADRAANAAPAPARAGLPVLATGLIVVAALGASGWVYNRLGAPLYPDLPLAKRLEAAEQRRATRPSQAEAEQVAQLPPPATNIDPSFADLMDKLRAAVASRPDDVAGLELLARNEAGLGNLDAARAAQTQLLQVKGDAATAQDHAAMAEILIVLAGGFVSTEAEDHLTRALTLDPKNGTARFYAGEMFLQWGRFDQAFSVWRALYDDSADGDPWKPALRASLPEVAARAGVDYQLPDSLRGPDAGAMAAAADMTPEERQAMIEGMVAQLGERLATEGGSAEEWARLITSLATLDRMDEARNIYAEAQTRFAGDNVALQGLRQAAVNSGVAE